MDLWTISLDSRREKRPFLSTPSLEQGGEISPDGKWIAYLSTDAG